MSDQKNDSIKWNGWGYEDSQFIVHDGELYFTGKRYNIGEESDKPLFPFKQWAKNALNVNVHIPKLPQQLSLPSKFPDTLVKKDFLTKLNSMKIRYSTSGESRLKKSHGQTLYEIFVLRTNQIPPRIPDIVISPKNHNEVCNIVNLAVEHKYVIVPFGGGTSVSGASSCPKNEPRPIIALDTLEMANMKWLNIHNLTACFESGITGKCLEETLNCKGYTCGHEPDSYEFSSLGGWVATRASGMKKNVYGNIEDILVGFRMVTPKGVLEKCQDIPRMSCGPDFTQLILGSEGTLGIITEVTLKIRPMPKIRKYNSFVFRNFENGFKCVREIARQRCQPASVRLMDNEQFKFGQALKHNPTAFIRFKDAIKKIYLFTWKQFNEHDICVMTLLFEGQRLKKVNEDFENIKQIAESFGGICGGENNGKIGYNLTFVIAYIRDLALTYGVVAESFETSVPWDKALTVYKSVKNIVQTTCKDLSINDYVISARITQTYDTGCCIYFYLAFNWVNQDDPIELFEHLETLARDQIMKNGGSLSHHHGIGKIRSKFYARQVSTFGADLYRVVKSYIDPENIFGVGNIICHL